MLCRLKILMRATFFFGRYKEKRIFGLRSIDGGVLDDRDAAADLRADCSVSSITSLLCPCSKASIIGPPQQRGSTISS